MHLCGIRFKVLYHALCQGRALFLILFFWLADAFQDPRLPSGKADVRLSFDENVAKMNLGGDHGAAWGWPFFHARRVASPGSYTFESMRYPGAFLSTSDMVRLGAKPADWGAVKLVLVSDEVAAFYFGICTSMHTKDFFLSTPDRAPLGICMSLCL
jgi:hypothetical protein